MTDGRDRRDVLRAGMALCSLGLAGCLDGIGGSGGNGTTNGTDDESDPSDDEPEPVTAWPQQQYDAQNTAAVPDADAPLLHVEELWRVDLGERVESSPVVAEGTIYARDLSGTVHAVDSGGSEQWTASVPEGELETTPAIYEDLLLVPHDAGVIAFDRSDGTEQWRYSSERGTTDLTVADGAVFFADTHRSVHAVEAETGARRWKWTENPGRGFYMEPPAVHDGDVILPKTAGSQVDFWEIAAIDVQTAGKRPLVRTSDYRFSAGISIAGDRMFAPTPGGVRAYDRDGDELWHFPTENPIEAGLAVGHEAMYVTTIGEDFSGTLHAIDTNNQEEKWSIDMIIDRDTGPILVGDSVAIGTLRQRVRGYDRRAGAVMWEVDVPVARFQQGTFVDGRFYLVSSGGILLSFGVS